MHFFFLNPCREYWSDLVDERGQAIEPARRRLMHTTMQTLGRVAIIGAGAIGVEFASLLTDLGSTVHLFASWSALWTT